MKCGFNAQEKLKDSGLRMAEKRIKFLNLLAETETPLTFEDLEKKVAKIMDKVTLYRAIEVFLEKKIIKTVDFGDGKTRYEIINEDEHHHHIICQKCKKVEEIEDCAVENSLLNFAKKSKSFAKIDSHSLEFFGTCKSCTK